MEQLPYISPEKLKDLTARRQAEFSVLFKKLKKKKPRNLDDVVQQLHTNAFNRFNCLECANCCSSISPIVAEKDIERIARHLKLKPAALIEQYLRMDEDGDYVFQKTPCPFLAADNYCMIYEQRPKACREYPHTDRKRFYQILDLTRKNCEVCPVVYHITGELVKREW